MKKRFTLILCFCLSVHFLWAQQNIYVSKSGDDLNNGSQSAPVLTLEKALSMVTADDATIFVEAGSYKMSTAAVLKPFNQTIIGADPVNTILDGDNAQSIINGITEFHHSEKTATFKNLSFINGYLRDDTSGAKGGGAAIRMGFKTNLHISNCYFNNNNSYFANISEAGAVYFYGNKITVDGCFFENNKSFNTISTGSPAGYGAAINVRHVFNTTGSTTVHEVGGATEAVIKNSTFYKNEAYSKGAAVYFAKQLDAWPDDDDATFVVQNCVFLDNITNTHANLGAALALSSGSNSTNNKQQTIILTNNTFQNNYSADAERKPVNKTTVLLEGFRYTSYMANNLILGNASATSGSVLFANQTAPIEYGKNNIIADINANINGTDFTTDALMKNNKIGNVTGVNLKSTLTNYPIASSFSNPYLEIETGSSAINAGTDSYIVNSVEYVLPTDIRGAEANGSRDIGAFEYQGIVSSVENVQPNHYSIELCNNSVCVKGLEKGTEIRLYGIRGEVLVNKVSDDSEESVNLPQRGIYILALNNTSYKIIF